MNQMAFDQTMQCVQGRRLKIGIGNDPINNHRTMIQKHLDQVVAGAAKPVEPRLADPRCLGYFFERGSRVVNDGDRQGLQQFLIGSS
ncbi:hypothetical protein [Klebsiella pneumoniae]|uniref:hypothetical protein n=1 Tax=Klebsiella pneumoniae TaxID=573 RepID=UPI00296EEF86|nr:hypothetical protein [Klebsiella pneumoniae]